MGFFSWQTADTNESIWNTYSGETVRPVYLLFPGGRPPIKEEAYEGYGVFGGKDAYAVLAHENALPGLNGDENHDRSIGIDFAFSDKYGNAKFKLKFSFNPKARYEDLPESGTCPSQGFFSDARVDEIFEDIKVKTGCM